MAPSRRWYRRRPRSRHGPSGSDPATGRTAAGPRTGASVPLPARIEPGGLPRWCRGAAGPRPRADTTPSAPTAPPSSRSGVLVLSLRLGPVGPAQPRLEAPEVGERLECRVPPHAAASTRRADRPRSVVEMLLRATAEVCERPARVRRAASRASHSDTARRSSVARSRASARRYVAPRAAHPTRPAPGHSQSGSLRPAVSRTAYASPLRTTASPATAARTGSRLVAGRRTADLSVPGTEPAPSSRPRPPVAAGTPRAGPAACRPADPRHPLVRLPVRLPQTPPHGLAVQIQRTTNRPNRRTLARPTTNLLPPIPSDHLDLPEHLTLRVDRRRRRRHLLFPSVIEVRTFQ